MTNQLFSNGYALIVGVGESSVKKLSLPVTVNDAEALYRVLTHPHLCAYHPERFTTPESTAAVPSPRETGLYPRGRAESPSAAMSGAASIFAGID